MKKNSRLQALYAQGKDKEDLEIKSLEQRQDEIEYEVGRYRLKGIGLLSRGR